MTFEADATRTTRDTYDRIAAAYSATIEGLVAGTWVGGYERGLMGRFLRMIGRSDASVLDIGCGGGKDTDYLGQQSVPVVGIDVSCGMLREARKRAPGGVFCRMDMRDLGFSARAFDGVWANGCIYHVPKADLAVVLQEVGRVLRPSGVFSFNFKAGTGEGLEENPASFGGGPRYFAYYGRGEMRDVLRRAGFRVLEMRRYPERVFEQEIIQAWARRS